MPCGKETATVVSDSKGLGPEWSRDSFPQPEGRQLTSHLEKATGVQGGGVPVTYSGQGSLHEGEGRAGPRGMAATGEARGERREQNLHDVTQS